MPVSKEPRSSVLRMVSRPRHRTPSPRCTPSPAMSQASVFSRLGSQRSPSPSPERSEDLTWTTLVDLCLLLAGYDDPPSASGMGFLDRETSRDAPSCLTFPPSIGVTMALTKAYEAFTSGHQLQDVSPRQIPGDVTTKPPVAKFGQGFKKKFHRGDDFPITIKSLTPTPDEVSFLKAGEDPTVFCKKVADTRIIYIIFSERTFESCHRSTGF